jgi:hypothetical protein
MVRTPPSPGTTMLGCQLITIFGLRTIPPAPSDVIRPPSWLSKPVK